MAANALVQTYINQGIKEKATSVLELMGLTVSEAVGILLTRTATDGTLPFSLAAEYDAWFRAKVQQALAEMQAEFRERRAATRDKIETTAE